jgi:hypothetical protein
MNIIVKIEHEKDLNYFMDFFMDLDSEERKNFRKHIEIYRIKTLIEKLH